ncbi:hypothetical protein DFH28DRAFT_191242 [Melampsora americana]|nr:hypothetical protein DFH28DRAFT_191242 [Melampsora americana]
MSQPQLDHPVQLDHYFDHPRDPPPLPHPTPDHQLTSSSSPFKIKKSKKPVPFNRLQLAAALLEYDPIPEEPLSDIQWNLQEIPPQTHSLSIRNASQSAIFIPFRAAPLSPPKPDFFSGIGLRQAQQPKSVHSGSGFGLADGSGRASISMDLRRSVAGKIEGIDLLESRPATALDLDEEAEVLSEWGLDNLLGDPAKKDKGKPKALTDFDSASPNDAQNIRENQLRHRAGRLPNDSDQPYQIKSDLFDFHFSDSRLQDANQTKTEDKFENVGVLDDEELLRQTTWCDPEGRKLVRPHTVYEMDKVRLGHLQPSQAGLLPTRRPTQSFQRSRQPSKLSAQASTLLSQRRHSAMPTTHGSKRHSRTHSLPPTGVMNFGVHTGDDHRTCARRTSTNTLSKTFNHISKSSTKQTHRRSQSVGTRISTAFEVEFKKKKKVPISVDPGTSDSVDHDPESQSPEAKAAKLKMRTSADIAQRYQQSIAMLEGRMSEDKAYQINSDTGSALGSDGRPEQGTGSQAGISAGSGTRPLTAQSMSSAIHGSEFSIGAPKEFTSRFDPKVNSVLGDQNKTESEPYGPEIDEEEIEEMDHVEEGESEETPIYDELGRIRFPTSLKPPVLIMPIPLTPNETVPEIQLQIPQVNVNHPEHVDQVEQHLDQEEGEVEETEEMRIKKKWAEQRPAGKLYGRSLIDELNSRKGAQKSRQMTFTGDGRKKMFADNLSPSDVTRPGSIYSNIDPDPEQAAESLPKSPTSPSHLAYKALSASQNKFNQALISSSRARQSVFGMDRIMAAELEKLKRIKAAEDAELREMEAKAEAKELKKQKKKGKKKKATEDEEEEKLEAADRVKSIRASHMLDQWDTMLLKDSSPSNDLQPETRPSPRRESSIPLPVISAIDSDEGRVGNMEDWFKDTPHDREDHTASPLHGFLGVDEDDDEDDGFGNVNSIARKLEIQAEKMNYKPLSNVHERQVMERGQSIESHAALLTMTQQSSSASHIPIITQDEDSDEDDQDRVPLIDVARQRQSRLVNLRHEDDAEDNVPLAQHRKSMMQPKPLAEEDDDDNRPLSQHLSSHMLSKLNTDRSHPGSRVSQAMGTRASFDRRQSSHLHSPVSSIHSPAGLSSHGTDEDIPLGIRATVLLAREHHPPIDLTHDSGSSEGLLGSSATHETDDVPLAVRASVMLSQKQPEPKAVPCSTGVDHKAASGPLDDEEKEALADSPSSEDDEVPLGYRASSQFIAGLPVTKPLRAPLQTCRTEEILNGSNRSIGGRSDDVPLGMKYDDDIPLGTRLSTLNPLYGAIGTGYNRMSQFGSLNTFQVPNSRLRGSSIPLQSQIPDEDEDDDVPLAKRASAMPSKVESRSSDIGPTHPAASMKIGVIPASSQFNETEEIEELAVLTSPLDQSIHGVTSPMKAENARADTLAALEGRNNPEENADDDVPLGVTRAAHTSTGTVRRPKKKKNKVVDQITEEVKEVGVGVGGSDEDDVPLAAQLPESQKQQMMMKMLIEQQNSAFGYALQHQSMLPLPIGASPMKMMMINHNQDGRIGFQSNLLEGADRRTVDSISRWREDIKP